MTSNIQQTPRTDRLRESDCDIDEFRALVSQETALADYPYAFDVLKNVLIYDAAALTDKGSDAAVRAEIQDELADALLNGPGIVVFKKAFTSEHAIEESTSTFRDIIRRQHESGVVGGDHFAKPGANDRIWSALQKLAIAEPEQFARYYSNDILALVSEAWLGPMYQVTSAINVVNPGGAAQNPHRDYHLGFMSTDTAAKFRAHIHRLSPALTLQGAVAHCDMPIESGPTMYLPYSQKFEAGYIAFNLPKFREYFADNYIQLPLEEGDAVFFNPALFHAAGHNTSSDIYRMANLLQVSSPFGRALDSVDREVIGSALYPILLDWTEQGRDREVDNVIAASAEGYAFPSNLDLDQPITGLAGETHAELVKRAVDSRMSVEEFDVAARALFARHQA
ncbi:phytanoyl-CoA dioxygenase [Rhodococcus sp. Eu-32]|uniref:phytanoyl-CoA dioxygenase family protein n=1 Tax=Rhodococcus sp. Eu-32 TaxID=1017319 RepID=UPI000DF1A171|nr:phytanoyl-CoA dioxygenase family protein [Rhodococcus sp. Eu-32]RRQ27205.1 phytanoyl-CoA dioxygenase [Rhodococcus sp. Eu-32]